jgi:hypothetical protein
MRPGAQGGGRDGEQRAVVAPDQPPAFLMHLSVMAPAEQHQVAQAGLAAVRPVPQVMAIGPLGRPVGIYKGLCPFRRVLRDVKSRRGFSS